MIDMAKKRKPNRKPDPEVNVGGRPEGTRHANAQKKHPERAHILAGPLGAEFWDHVDQVAKAQGSNFSAYVRSAVIEQMRQDGMPFSRS